MNNFKKAEITSYKDQKGVDLVIQTASGELKASIYICKIEGHHLKVNIENHQDFDLDITVSANEYTTPTVSYSDDKTCCYLTLSHMSVHVKIGDEGIIFDIWDSEAESNGVVDSTYIYFNEINDREDIAENAV